LINISLNTKWTQNEINIPERNRLNPPSSPHSIYVDDDQTIYIDSMNDRIVSRKCDSKNGQVVAGVNVQEDRPKQLSFQTDVIVDKKNDSLIICDNRNRRLVLWSRSNGTIRSIIISDIDRCSLNNRYAYVADTEKHDVKQWKILLAMEKIINSIFFL
jgi:hypothetical protein